MRVLQQIFSSILFDITAAAAIGSYDIGGMVGTLTVGYTSDSLLVSRNNTFLETCSIKSICLCNFYDCSHGEGKTT